MKLLFKPFSILAGRLAGLTSRRLVDRLWALVGEERPPRADQRSAGWGRLAAAMLLEGAVFRVVSGLADHAARHAFSRLTGSWPGEEEEEEREEKRGDPQEG
jgi:hypothetical protein